MAKPFESPPIALTSLSIRDFRGIDDLKLEFLGPDGRPNRLAVISGPNGSGKTTVLEAALIALGGADLAVGRIGKPAIRRGAEDYKIQAELSYRSQNHSDEMLTATAKAEDHPEFPGRTIAYWYFSSWRKPDLIGAVDVSVGGPGRKPAKTDENRLRNVKQQLVNASAVENFPGTTKSLFASNYSGLIEKNNTSWIRFNPDNTSGFFVGLLEEGEPGPGAFDVFYRRDEQPRLPIDDLGAGQIELFLFLAALVLNDDREGIVFIDEPELHLDPQWHAPMVRTLMRLQPRAQFVVATHSPEIYAAASSFERHFLVPEDDPRAWAWPTVGAEA